MASFFCPDCRAGYEPEDNYCRKCGMFLGALRAVAPAPKEDVRALVQVRPGMPAPMKKAATALAIGTALQIGVGLAGKYLAAQAGKQALTAAATKPNKTRAISKAGVDPIPDVIGVSETLTIQRIWLRRR